LSEVWDEAFDECWPIEPVRLLTLALPMNLSFGVPALAGQDRLKAELLAHYPVGSRLPTHLQFLDGLAAHEPQKNIEHRTSDTEPPIRRTIRCSAFDAGCSMVLQVRGSAAHCAHL